MISRNVDNPRHFVTERGVGNSTMNIDHSESIKMSLHVKVIRVVKCLEVGITSWPT
jgi:hypothetical protein